MWRGDKPSPERGFVALGVARSLSNAALASGLLTNSACSPSSRSCLTSNPHGCSCAQCCQSAAQAAAHNQATWDTLQLLLGEPGGVWPHARRSARPHQPTGARGRAASPSWRNADLRLLSAVCASCPASAKQPRAETCSATVAGTTVLARAAPPAPHDSGPGDWPHSWQLRAPRVLHTYHSTLPPAHMHVALRRRLRLPLPLAHGLCGGAGVPGCGAVLDVLGDHAAACPRSGLLARQAGLGSRCAADDRRRHSPRRGPLLRCDAGLVCAPEWPPLSAGC